MTHPSNVEIYQWFDAQNYQTEEGDPEYEMCFVLDIPKIVTDYTEFLTLREKPENLVLRELLWKHHGHDGLYGDDGEMQCAKCGLDFKRDPIEKIQEQFHILGFGNFMKDALK